MNHYLEVKFELLVMPEPKKEPAPPLEPVEIKFGCGQWLATNRNKDVRDSFSSF
ncbi:MAG TPA: hypothetical protein VIJ57_08145 [Hanamia sp.]